MSCGVFPARRALGIGPALNTRKGGKIRIAVFCDAAGTKQAVMTHGHNTAELDRLTVGKVYRVQRLKIDNRLPDIKIAEHGVYSMQFQEGRSSFRYGLGQVCWSVLCVQDRPRSLCREVDVADFPAYIPTFQRLEAILEELVLAHEALPPQVRSKCPPEELKLRQLFNVIAAVEKVTESTTVTTKLQTVDLTDDSVPTFKLKLWGAAGTLGEADSAKVIGVTDVNVTLHPTYGLQLNSTCSSIIVSPVEGPVAEEMRAWAATALTFNPYPARLKCERFLCISSCPSQWSNAIVDQQANGWWGC